MDKLQQLTTLFGLSNSERLIHEKLFVQGGMSAGELAKKINVSRPAIYDIAEKLIQKGLVTQSMQEGVKIFSAQKLDRVQELLKEKQEELNRSQAALKNLQKTELDLQKTFGPRLQIFEGRKALQQMMRSVFFYDDIEIRAYWPIKNVMKILTPEFFEDYDNKRNRIAVPVKTIWPKNQCPSFTKYPFLRPGKDRLREIRVAPGDLDFTLGYNIHGNTVRFISSEKENFGFLVESHELAKTMQSQFDILWKLSKPLSIKK